MRLKELHIAGFKSFAKKTALVFHAPITAIVGPNGSGKSNAVESFRFALGEQSMKAMRGKRGEDLIWDGSRTLPKANRASVKVVFDNTGGSASDETLAGRLGVDFDEVSIERTVYRDASHEYAVNGSRVRLKDVLELLAGAHVGATGHHIISQGEADRILLASPKERKATLEEALGLRLYHIRKADAEKKRAETAANRKEVASLRREIAPHLAFLKKQVTRAEEAARLKDRLIARYRAYFAGEMTAHDRAREQLAEEKRSASEKITLLKSENADDTRGSSEDEADPERALIAELDRQLTAVRGKREVETRALGRLEGKLATLEETVETRRAPHVPHEEVSAFLVDLDRALAELVEIEDAVLQVQKISAIRERAGAFLERVSGKRVQQGSVDPNQEETTRERDALLASVAETGKEEATLLEKRRSLEHAAAAERVAFRERERLRLARASALRDAERHITDVARREGVQLDLEMALKREQGEAALSFGRGVLPTPEEISKSSGPQAHGESREIERMKAAFEAIDPGASDAVIREYETTRDRDSFLSREIADLEQADASLLGLIRELEAELSVKFAEGVQATSARFHELFSLMFDGGKASLVVTRPRARSMEQPARIDSRSVSGGEEGSMEEETASDAGIDIEVALPRKKTKGLHALSGGERALTAIALTFAIAQVNPPPFLILDETDAALDEANSRRYGDMIERIAEHSQLILITHNRETMSRAGILYGVTMGADGASELLSVKLDEALAVAK